MSYAPQYKLLILKETQTPKNKIIPRKVYKIVTYQYRDGSLKTLTGTKTSYVFLLGITPDRVLNCIKISEVQPIKFFNWLKLQLVPNIDYDQIVQKINSNELHEIVNKDTRIGTKIFQKLKPNQIYNQQPGSYRTYFLSKVKAIEEVTFDTSKIMRLLRIPKPSKNTQNTENP